MGILIYQGPVSRGGNDGARIQCVKNLIHELFHVGSVYHHYVCVLNQLHVGRRQVVVVKAARICWGHEV